MAAQRPSPYQVEFYEGLVRKTAGMTAPLVEDEYEDIVQILRLKCWRAINAYSESRSTLPVERFVFSCMRNQVKDLMKRKRRNLAYIEDFRGVTAGPQVEAVESDRSFDARYLALSEDDAFADVEGERPLIPSTLSELELRVLALLYANYTQREAAMSLSVPRGEVERAVKAIRAKMADWRPDGAAEVAVAA